MFDGLNLPVNSAIAAIGTSITLTALLVIWVFDRFQTKKSAKADRDDHGERIKKIESDMVEVKTSVAAFEIMSARVGKIEDGIVQIAKETSYIRGRVEPK